MAPLACDPTALDHAGVTVVATGQSLGWSISAMTAALSCSAGMAGDDPVGAAFGREYDGAAAKLIDAMTSVRNGLCGIGDGLRVSAHNYAVADASSDLTGRAGGLPIPKVSAPLTAGSKPPPAVGAGTGAPAGWGWVAPYVGMIWPSGESAKLRTAAAAWTTAGANFVATETAAGGGTMAAIGAQQLPETLAINKALSDASEATINVARQCQTIAAQLNSYAAKIDRVHAAILDLLSRICDPLTGIKEVWDLLTDEDEDEIKRIADDIRTVVDNFAHEAETLGDQIQAAVSAAVGAAEEMGRWAGHEWDHFLHDTPVGRALNQVGQGLKGLGEEGLDFVEQLTKFSPSRLQSNPVGFVKDAVGTVEEEAPLLGLGPDGGPGVGEAWKAAGKQVTHWDEWASNPAEALGKTIFDVGTFALPGGPLSKLGKLGRGAADALKGLNKPLIEDIPKPPSVKPPVETPPPASKPAEPRSPEPGSPGGKPAPRPNNGPLPHGPTESKPPVGEKPPAGEPPKSPTAPSASNAEPVRVPANPPAEHLAAAHPISEAPAPANTPKVPGPQPAEGAPSTPRAPSLPPAVTPPSVPTGFPGEAPPSLGELPLGGGPSVHPPDVPRPHDDPPHPLEGEGPPVDPAETHPTEPPPPNDSPPSGHQSDQLAEPANEAPEHGELPETARKAISGHGSYDPDNGLFVVPKGSSVTTYADHGSTITDSLGNLIETGGDTSGIFSKTFHAGESLPNYTIHPPDGLNILGSPLTVLKPTLISELINEGMGAIDLAVCTYDPFNPSGMVYHLTGIYDKMNSKFTPYERP